MVKKFDTLATIVAAITPSLFLLTPFLLQENYFNGFGAIPYIILLPPIIIAFIFAIKARFRTHLYYHWYIVLFIVFSFTSIKGNPLPNPFAVIIIIAFGYSLAIIIIKYSKYELFKRYYILSIIALNIVLIVLSFIQLPQFKFIGLRYLTVLLPGKGLYLDVFTLGAVNYLALVFAADSISISNNKFNNIIYTIVMIILSSLIYLTQARSFIISLLLLYLVFIINNIKKWKLYKLIIAGTVFALLIIFYWQNTIMPGIDTERDEIEIENMLYRSKAEMEESDNFRIQASITMLQLWSESPKNMVMGIGLWNVPKKIAQKDPELSHIKISDKGGLRDPYVYPHNLPLWILTGTGLIGATLMAIYYFLFGRDVLRNTTRKNRALNMTVAFFFILIINLFFPIANIAYAVSTAALLSCTSILRATPQDK